MLQTITNVSTIVASVVAIIGVIIGLYQIRQFSKSEKSANQAYISVKYVTGLARQKPAVFLVIRNHGNSSATNVRISFDNGAKWHFVANPQKFPFLQPSGIAEILPGSKLKYFVGTLANNSPLHALKTDSVMATLQYLDKSVGKSESRISLTLQDEAYLAR
jgi:hypothetical protein